MPLACRAGAMQPRAIASVLYHVCKALLRKLRTQIIKPPPRVGIEGHLRRAVALRLLRRTLRGVQRGVAPLQGILHALYNPVPEVVCVCSDQPGMLLMTNTCCILPTIMASAALDPS